MSDQVRESTQNQLCQSTCHHMNATVLVATTAVTHNSVTIHTEAPMWSVIILAVACSSASLCHMGIVCALRIWQTIASLAASRADLTHDASLSPVTSHSTLDSDADRYVSAMQVRGVCEWQCSLMLLLITSSPKDNFHPAIAELIHSHHVKPLPPFDSHEVQHPQLATP